jgi:predicted nucleic acid-binding protein
VTVVVDTGALFAVYDADDQAHSAVRRIIEQVPGPYILSPLVLAEIDYLLLKRLGQDAELQFLEDVVSGAYQLDPLTDLDVVRCREIILQYSALNVGAADASIVAAAERHGTLQLLTLDQRDFRAMKTRMGQPFILLPYDAP